MAHAGSAIRAMREAQDLGLRELAEMCGASVSYLSLVERGLKTPTDQWLRKVTRILGEHMAAKDGDAA